VTEIIAGVLREAFNKLSGDTPLQKAQEKGHKEIVELLRKYGANE
jgi:ankyrin repeat protein